MDTDADREVDVSATEVDDCSAGLSNASIPVYTDCDSDERPWMRSGRLYVGHPIGLAARNVVIPDMAILLRHPTERAREIKAIADSGVDIYWSDPHAADQFTGDRVLVISKTGKMAPLWAHPEWKGWCGMPCGEIWAVLGEDWVDAAADALAQVRAVSLAQAQARWSTS